MERGLGNVASCAEGLRKKNLNEPLPYQRTGEKGKIGKETTTDGGRVENGRREVQMGKREREMACELGRQKWV